MQYVKSQALAASVMACTLLALACALAGAAELSVTVRQSDAKPLAGVVVAFEPATPVASPRGLPSATVNQKNLMFAPEILVVRTGTAVEFPNLDPVRHQVYSFSSAKKFQLSLYSGNVHSPIVFDKPGLVTLGCNIHDSMIGYIYVTDSPWFGRTDKGGSLRMRELPAGNYSVQIWHPAINDSATSLHQPVSLAAGAVQQLEFKLTKPITAPPQSNGAARQWEDY